MSSQNSGGDGLLADDIILIEGLEFYGFHGVPEAEQAIGHRYVVNVRLSVDTRPAGGSDEVADTVNYAEVAAVVLAVGTGAQYRLLERLAAQMAQEILAHFVQVKAINLRLCKLLPPMNAIVAAVGVEITRQRSDTLK